MMKAELSGAEASAEEMRMWTAESTFRQGRGNLFPQVRKCSTKSESQVCWRESEGNSRSKSNRKNQRSWVNMNHDPIKMGLFSFLFFWEGMGVSMCFFFSIWWLATSSKKMIDATLTSYSCRCSQESHKKGLCGGILHHTSLPHTIQPGRPHLKGLFTIFLFSVRTHILDSNGVWYSWFWSEGSINALNPKFWGFYFVPRDLDSWPKIKKLWTIPLSSGLVISGCPCSYHCRTFTFIVLWMAWSVSTVSTDFYCFTFTFIVLGRAWSVSIFTFIVLWMAWSVSTSTDAVASSRRRILFLYNGR